MTVSGGTHNVKIDRVMCRVPPNLNMYPYQTFVDGPWSTTMANARVSQRCRVQVHTSEHITACPRPSSDDALCFVFIAAISRPPLFSLSG